jgi:hypothetical protein
LAVLIVVSFPEMELPEIVIQLPKLLEPGDKEFVRRLREEVWEWLRDVARTALQLENGLRYIDMNVTVGKGYGVTAGIILSEEGVQWYAGVALAVGASVSVTGSEQRATPGWNAAAQFNLPPLAYQAGLDPTGRLFTESGVSYSPPGSFSFPFSATGFYVSEPYLSP